MIHEWAKIDEEHKLTMQPFLEEIPVRVAGIARALGIEVKAATLKPRISGQIGPSDTSLSGFRIRINRHEVKTRQRFTIAHEIAHFLLHRDDIGEGIEDSILYRSTLSDKREAEANRLGASILMPEVNVVRSLRELGGKATPEVAKLLADKYDVSEPAMKIRLGLK